MHSLLPSETQPGGPEVTMQRRHARQKANETKAKNAAYLGFNTDLLEHMRNKGLREILRGNVRTWLMHKHEIPACYTGLTWGDLHIHHIMPQTQGVLDHPYNYYILPCHVNLQLGEWTTPQVVKVVGAESIRQPNILHAG